MEPAGRTAFPLVPRYRLTGLPFGSARSTRRGRGSDLAGFRSYVPGDPISTIDWRASARLSFARGEDKFIVRERFADEAPVAVVVLDRRPTMGLYPEWSPWLAKPEAARVAAEAIVASAIAARGSVGYLDSAGGNDDPFWISPRSRSPLELIEERMRIAEFDAAADSLVRSIEYLARSGRSLGAGSFVFVLSDFLDPPPDTVWLSGIARRWEIVPVVIQDRIWEQSFPSAGPVLMPIVDPEDGAVREVRFRRSEARAEGELRERARSDFLHGLASFGLDPVLLDTSEPEDVHRAFLDWAERRRRALWQHR